MLNIPALEKLVHELSRLPGIGPKTAQRLAYFILKAKDSYPTQLSEALQRVQAEVHSCTECFNYTDRDICRYCEDIHRNSDLLCLVEEPSDISRIESSAAFRGRYHVLHGVISPLEGITAKNLKIAELLHKIEEGISGLRPPIKEIIFAFDADLEGDTTALYLTKVLQNKGIKISRIAHGIPMGSDIDFIDDRTMGRALENRVEL
ncbi:MAG: recombination mediator RecR [Bdellovibrionaceae bacterium]|nr:recombination mediator RecR [Pseudobdellovibrionaceae bacterium]